MNIALIDEEKFELETAEVYLRKYIRENWAAHKSEICIETFPNAKYFLKFFSRGMYDLIIVGFCTVEISKFLRAHDHNVKIFFLPHEEDYEENLL